MSATGRGAIRQKDDSYQTPAFAVDAILPHLPIGGHILEPGCGRGAIVKRLLHHGVPAAHVFGVELDKARAKACAQLGIDVAAEDFLTYKLGGFALVLGNPPFGLALPFALNCLALTAPVRGTTALLVRLSWVAPQERGDLFKEHPADIYALDRRPEFVASLHCTANDTKRGCGWAETLEIDAKRPKRCPKCGGRIECNTSDAAEYCFVVWGPGRGGRWYRLHCPRGDA